MARQRRKKHTRLVHSQFALFLERLLKARTRPPVSDGEMVFSSTKIIPPCSRSSSAQAFSKGGIVLRRSEEHTSELQSRGHLVCRLLLVNSNQVADRSLCRN